MADRPWPDLATEEGRLAHIRFLNDRLPRKRVIAQGLIRSEDGRLLLCELTYKREWDLPGGVVDPDEAPAHCVVREVREELGLEVEAGALLAVNWLPAWRGWSDALSLTFDLGTGANDLPSRARLQRREIRALHWCGPEDLMRHVAPYNQRLLSFLATHDGSTAYLHDSMRTI
jgi:8-oxo-dGTP pyrophosphatase MutT (NUDIX family)